MDTTQTLYVTVKTVYGKDTYYPACNMTTLLCQIAGTRTVTDSMLATIKRAGFVVSTKAEVTTL